MSLSTFPGLAALGGVGLFAQTGADRALAEALYDEGGG
jgi:hypothetical protein